MTCFNPSKNSFLIIDIFGEHANPVRDQKKSKQGWLIRPGIVTKNNLQFLMP